MKGFVSNPHNSLISIIEFFKRTINTLNHTLQPRVNQTIRNLFVSPELATKWSCEVLT